MKTTVKTAGGTPAHPKTEESFFLTSRQLARRWGLCKQTVLKISQECQLPSVSFGDQTIRFPIGPIKEIERKIIGSKFPIMRAIREACGVPKIRGRKKTAAGHPAASTVSTTSAVGPGGEIS